jgi:hypothetical protein
MCTWIIEKAALQGSAKGAEGWFELSEAAVYYDHPYHAPFDHVLTVDFARDQTKPDHRVRVELDYDSARRLIASMQAALDSGIDAHAVDDVEQAHAEVGAAG